MALAPEVLVLDEPTLALDAPVQQQVLALLADPRQPCTHALIAEAHLT